MRGMAYFPLAGLIVGILVSTFFDVITVVLGMPPVVAAGMSQVASFWATMGLEVVGREHKFSKS